MKVALYWICTAASDLYLPYLVIVINHKFKHQYLLENGVSVSKRHFKLNHLT